MQTEAERMPNADPDGRSSNRLALCYHSVSDSWASHLAVPVARFEQQLAYLTRRGYRSVTLSELVAGEPRGRTVAITFDDGYLSVVRNAFPLLRRFRMTATLFVPTDYLDAAEPASWDGVRQWRGSPQEHELELMGWGEVRELAAAGWEIGSHSRTHAQLVNLAPTKLRDELVGSRLACEQQVQQPCRSLAYPYGAFGIDVDHATAAAAAAAGYTAACTAPRRLWPYEPLLWPRVSIGRADSLPTFRAKVSPWVRRVRSTGVWSAATAPRRVMRDHLFDAKERAAAAPRHGD